MAGIEQTVHSQYGFLVSDHHITLTGLCADCTGPDSICCQIVTTRICRPAGRIKVVLVGEELGF